MASNDVLDLVIRRGVEKTRKKAEQHYEDTTGQQVPRLFSAPVSRSGDAKQNKGADKPVQEPVTGQDAETDLIGSTKKIARTGSASRRREQAQSGYEDVYKRRKLQSDAWMAEKAHADYIKSDEYRQRTAEREKKLQQDRFMKQLLTGVADIQEPQLIEDEKEVQLRAAARQARAAADAEEDAAVVRRDMAEIGAMSDEERRQLERFAVGQDVDYFDSMNFAQNGLQIGRAERQAAGLMEKYGEKRLNELANTLRRQQNARMAQEAAQKGREQVTGGFWNGVGESAATVPIMAANGPMAALSFLRELSRGDDRYSSLDPNAIGNMGSVYSGAVRGQVQQNIEGEDPGFWRKAASVGYQGIMAAADSVAQAYLGGGAWGGAALAATNSFSQTMAEASRNGATPGEAALLATSTAAIEVLSEKIPLDELIKTAGRNKQGVRQIVKTALAQAGIEATTEEISLVGSLLLEAAILGEKSGYEQTAMQGILQGKSVAQARQDAAMEVWNEAVNTAMVSGFSGFASSGGAGIAGNVRGAMRDARANLPDAGRIKRDALAMARELDSQGEGAQPPQTEPEQAQNGADIAVQANEAVPSPAPEQQMVEQAAAETVGVQQETQPQASESTVINTDPAQHTPQEQATIDAYQNSVDDNLVEYVEAVRNNPGQKMPRYPLKDVDTRAAEDIKRITGIDVSGNKTQIEARAVEHILKRHGENGKGDRSMRDVYDIARIQYVIDNYDSMEHGGKSSAYVYQNEKGRNVHAQTVILKKKVNGTYFVVEAVPDTKKKTLFIVSAYMSQNGQNETAPSLSGDAEAYRVTSDNATKSDAVSNNSIPENDAEVNGNPESAPTADTQNQSAEGGQPIKGTGAAEANFTEKAAYQELLYKGNVQRDRPDDVRPVEVPKTDAYGRNVSEFVGDAYGARVTSDRMANEIESLVQEGALGFDRRSNRQSLETARDYIYGRDGEKGKGEVSTRNEITRNIANGKIQDGDIEKAMLLYAKYANRKSQTAQENASELMVDLATLANMTGRNLQLFKLLRRMTPEGQLMTIEKQVQRNAEKMVKNGSVKKGYEPALDPELSDAYVEAAKEYQEAKTPKEKQDAEQKVKEIEKSIYVYEAAKMPATFKAKWDAWRYMAMLGNVKTQARNIVGNAAFIPYKAAKDKMAAVFEKALPKDQRTKAVFADRELLQWAKSDRESQTVRDALQYSAKLGDDVSGEKIRENMKIFNNRTMESVRRFVEMVPQKGDMLFKNGYYERSLAGFLKARGYTVADIQGGKISEETLNEARSYAIEEAMKATFNDCNAFSDAVASIGKKKEDNAWSKALNIAAEGILPFRRTPANIAVRFTEYSPVGLVKGAWNAATKIRNGEISAAAAIDQMAAGLSGSAVMALGFFLAKGIGGVKITGSGTDEDEKRQGRQDYAVEFSFDGQEYSYKIDWAAPANLPLFVGANICKALEDAGADTDVSAFTSILRGLGTMFEPMLSLSCLSSLNDLVEGIRYAEEGEALYTIAADVATSYFTQGIPALARQTAQALQENRQTTFANDADPTIRDLQKTAANVPFAGAKYQTDKINAWGEAESTGSAAARVINAFLNPGTLKKISTDALEKEISRLNEVQTESVSPPTAPKTVSYTDRDGNAHKDVRLTEEQYHTLAVTQGQTAKRILSDMLESASYQALTDEQKAAAIRDVYSYAKEAGEIAAMEDHVGYSASWMQELKKDSEAQAITRRIAGSSLDAALSGIRDAEKSGWSAEADETALETAYGTYSKLSPSEKKAVLDSADTNVRSYIEARQANVSQALYLGITKTVANLRPEEGRKAPSQKQEIEAVASYPGLSEKQRVLIAKMYASDAQDENIDQLAEMGYSLKEYAKLYRDYEDYTKGTGKKKRTITHWQKEYGISYDAAEALYEVFG